MNICFFIIVILEVLGLGMILVKDGEPKEGEYSFLASLIETIVNISLIAMAIAVGF